jgi:hypothetical protein
MKFSLFVKKALLNFIVDFKPKKKDRFLLRSFDVFYSTQAPSYFNNIIDLLGIDNTVVIFKVNKQIKYA